MPVVVIINELFNLQKQQLSSDKKQMKRNEQNNNLAQSAPCWQLPIVFRDTKELHNASTVIQYFELFFTPSIESWSITCTRDRQQQQQMFEHSPIIFQTLLLLQLVIAVCLFVFICSGNVDFSCMLWLQRKSCIQLLLGNIVQSTH